MSNPAFSATYSGFVAGDDASDLAGSITSPAIATSPVGSYPIDPIGLTSPNYAIAFIDGTLSVDPAALTVTADDATKTYGQPLTFGGTEFTAAGLVAGDTVSSVTLASAGAPARAGVGGSSITPSGAQGSGLSNYAIAYADGTLSVDPAALTVRANDASRPEEEPNPAFTASYAGFVPGEGAGDLGGALTFATLATTASPAADYELTPGGVTSDNYDIAFVDGVLTVTPDGGDDNGGGGAEGEGGGGGGAQPATASPVLTASTRRLWRGAMPLTPGDASFRTDRARRPARQFRSVRVDLFAGGGGAARTCRR